MEKRSAALRQVVGGGDHLDPPARAERVTYLVRWNARIDAAMRVAHADIEALADDTEEEPDEARPSSWFKNVDRFSDVIIASRSSKTRQQGDTSRARRAGIHSGTIVDAGRLPRWCASGGAVAAAAAIC